MTEQCYLVPGEFGILIQLILGCVSICLLITKYRLEKPRRLFSMFLKDLISILCGSSIIHFLNISLCIFIFRYNLLLYIYNINLDECSIYYLHIIIDATLGIYIEYKLFPLFKFIKIRKYYLESNSKSSIYKPVDVLSHFSEFVNLTYNNSKNNIEDVKINKNFMQNYLNNFKTYIKTKMGYKEEFNDINNKNENDINTEIYNKEIEENPIYKQNDKLHNENENSKSTINKEKKNKSAFKKSIFYNNGNKELLLLNEDNQDKKFSIIYSEDITNEYEENLIIYEHNEINIVNENYEKYSEINIIHNILLWVSVVLTMKIIVLLFFFIFFPILNIFAFYTVSYIENIKMKLLFVMIILPFFLNLIIYFCTDNIIKSKNKHLNAYNNDRI